MDKDETIKIETAGAVGSSDLLGIPTDTELLDYLASLWDSQGEGHSICGSWFNNPTGSFRDAIHARINATKKLK